MCCALLSRALALCIIIERAKKCLDFAFTFHFVHFVGCWCHSGFPSCWEWWMANSASLIAMALLGEYLCMKRELQEIPLFSPSGAGVSNTYSRVSRRHTGSMEV